MERGRELGLWRSGVVGGVGGGWGGGSGGEGGVGTRPRFAYNFHGGR